ncbi:unnamed protein product, partial [Amoebophrya sp. A120]|eukprot:GSA120T00008790001.1
MVVSLLFPRLSHIKAALLLGLSVAGVSGFDKNAAENPPSSIAAKSPPNTETPTDVVGAAPIMAAAPAVSPVQVEEGETTDERKFLSPRPGAKRHWLLQQGTDWNMSSFSLFQRTTSGATPTSSGKSENPNGVSAPTRTPGSTDGREDVQHQDVLVDGTIVSSTLSSTSPSVESGDPQEPPAVDVHSEKSEFTASPASGTGEGGGDASTATSTSFLLEQEAAAARTLTQAGSTGTGSSTSSSVSARPRKKASRRLPIRRRRRSQSTSSSSTSKSPDQTPRRSRAASARSHRTPPRRSPRRGRRSRSTSSSSDSARSDATSGQVVQNSWYKELLDKSGGRKEQEFDTMKKLTKDGFRDMQKRGPNTFKHLTDKAFKNRKLRNEQEMLAAWEKVLDEKMVEGRAEYYTDTQNQNEEGDDDTSEVSDGGDLARVSWTPTPSKPGEKSALDIGEQLGSGTYGVVYSVSGDATKVVKTVRCKHFRVLVGEEDGEEDEDSVADSDECGVFVRAEIIMNTLLTQAAPNAVVTFDRVVVTRKGQSSTNLVNEGETSFHFVLERVAIPELDETPVTGATTTYVHVSVDMIAGALRSADGLAKSMYAKILELGDLGFVHNDIKTNNMGFRSDHTTGVTSYDQPVFFDFGMSSFVAVHDEMTTPVDHE